MPKEFVFGVVGEDGKDCFGQGPSHEPAQPLGALAMLDEAYPGGYHAAGVGAAIVFWVDFLSDIGCHGLCLLWGYRFFGSRLLRV